MHRSPVKKTAVAVLVALAAFFGALTATAFASSSIMSVAAGSGSAADVPGPTDPPILDLIRPIYDAVVHGQYWLGAAAGLVLAVALTRRYLGPKFPILHSDAGGALLTLAASFGAAVATALAAGGAVMSLHLAWIALLVAISAAGGYSLLNKLLRPLEDLAPAWMQPVFRIITWIFDKPSAATEEAEAAAAGDAAVAARPSTGIAGIAGKPRDVA